MRSLAVLAATLLAASLFRCGSSEGEAQTLLVFDDWIRVQASCADYSFRAPPDIVEQDAQGVDSCRQRWLTSSCEYSADYSSLASDLSEFVEVPQYQELEEVISGRPAKLVSALLADTELRYLAAVTIPEVDPALPGSRLTLDTRCRSSAGQLDALSVFRTLALPE